MSSTREVNAGERNQPAVVMLKLRGDEEKVSCYCRVTRITPGGVRLETTAVNSQIFEGVFCRNREVEVFLPLPRPLPPVETRARLVGLQVKYAADEPIPVIFDLEFLDLSVGEEEALRDSNPGLLCLRAS